MLISAELKGCVTWLIYFLNRPCVRYEGAKFDHCRICVTDFKEGQPLCPPPFHPWAAPKKPTLNRVKNAYLPFLIDKVIKRYLDYNFCSNQTKLKDKSDVHYFKLPYIATFSHHIKNKLSNFCKEFCKENFNIKLVFSSFQIKNS